MPPFPSINLSFCITDVFEYCIFNYNMRSSYRNEWTSCKCTEANGKKASGKKQKDKSLALCRNAKHLARGLWAQAHLRRADESIYQLAFGKSECQV